MYKHCQSEKISTSRVQLKSLILIVREVLCLQTNHNHRGLKLLSSCSVLTKQSQKNFLEIPFRFFSVTVRIKAFRTSESSKNCVVALHRIPPCVTIMCNIAMLMIRKNNSENFCFWNQGWSRLKKIAVHFYTYYKPGLF